MHGNSMLGKSLTPKEWANQHRANAIAKCERAWRDAHGGRHTMAGYSTATDFGDRDGYIAARVQALIDSFSPEELDIYSSPAPQPPVVPDFMLTEPIRATFMKDLSRSVTESNAAYDAACKAYKAEYDAWMAAGDAAYGPYEANHAVWTSLQARVARATTDAACDYERRNKPQPTGTQQKPVNKGLVVLDFGIPEDPAAIKAAAKELKEAKRLAALRPATIAAAPAAAGGSPELVSAAAPADFVAGTLQSELASPELVSTAAPADFVAGTLQSEAASQPPPYASTECSLHAVFQGSSSWSPSAHSSSPAASSAGKEFAPSAAPSSALHRQRGGRGRGGRPFPASASGGGSTLQRDSRPASRVPAWLVNFVSFKELHEFLFKTSFDAIKAAGHSPALLYARAASLIFEGKSGRCGETIGAMSALLKGDHTQQTEFCQVMSAMFAAFPQHAPSSFKPESAVPSHSDPSLPSAAPEAAQALLAEPAPEAAQLPQASSAEQLQQAFQFGAQAAITSMTLQHQQAAAQQEFFLQQQAAQLAYQQAQQSPEQVAHQMAAFFGPPDQ